MTDALASALRPWIIADPAVGANYSLHLSTEPNHRHLLFRGACVEVTTADPQRAVDALLRHLQPPEANAAVASFAAVALVRDGRATIIDDAFRASVAVRERRLADLGYSRSDAREVAIDVVAGDVVVPTGIDVDRSPLTDVVATLPAARRAGRPVAPASHPIEAWVFPTRSGEPTVPVATYRALAGLAARETELSVLTDRVLSLFSGVRREVADPERTGDLVRVLR